MYPELWITSNQQVYMIRHNFHLNELLSPLLNRFKDDSFQAFVYRMDEDFTSVLWTKYHVIMTDIGYVVVGFQFVLHRDSIPRGNRCVKAIYCHVCALYPPVWKARGLTARRLTTTYNSAVPATKSRFVLATSLGTTLQKSVRVTNNGTAAGKVDIYPVSATTSMNGGIAYLPKSALLRDDAAWIALHDRQLTLAPGQSQTISFQVVVPSSARAGQHFGGIAAENLTPSSSPAGGQIHINIQTRYIVPIEIDLPGPTVEQMAVTGAKAGGSNGYQSLLVGMSNTGNQMLKPYGNLSVSNAQGQLLQVLNLKLSTILPDTSIDYPVYVQKQALAAGDYQVSLYLNYGHGKTLDYTTKLTITQEQVNQAFSNSPLQAPTGNAMPLWQIILVALAALIVLLLGGQKLYGLISARRRKQTKDHTPSTDGSNQSMDTSKKREKVAK